MAASRRTLLRRQAAGLGVAAVVVAVGAFAWNQAGDDGDDVIHLDTPGEFIDPASTNPNYSGDPLPRFELTDADDEDVRLEPDGRPLVVNLWYSTCPPCARELGAFAAVDAEFGDRVRFVGVNNYDDADTMERFAGERGVDYELLMDPDDVVGRELRVLQFPVTFFVSADGDIVTQTGPLSENELREHVAELLA